jgi:hypothetical protein
MVVIVALPAGPAANPDRGRLVRAIWRLSGACGQGAEVSWLMAEPPV